MADQPGGTADLYALLIGIDCYLPNAIPGAGTYPTALPAAEPTRAEQRTPPAARQGGPTRGTARAPALAPDEPWVTAQVTLHVLPEGAFRDVTR